MTVLLLKISVFFNENCEKIFYYEPHIKSVFDPAWFDSVIKQPKHNRKHATLSVCLTHLLSLLVSGVAGPPGDPGSVGLKGEKGDKGFSVQGPPGFPGVKGQV